MTGSCCPWLNALNIIECKLPIFPRKFYRTSSLLVLVSMAILLSIRKNRIVIFNKIYYEIYILYTVTSVSKKVNVIVCNQLAVRVGTSIRRPTCTLKYYSPILKYRPSYCGVVQFIVNLFRLWLGISLLTSQRQA